MPEAALSTEQICAHRGASGTYPENTHAAFDAAASVGAGWIETDIQCLADGELVIFHDALDQAARHAMEGMAQIQQEVTGNTQLRELLDA